jgi:hypothetical protein
VRAFFGHSNGRIRNLEKQVKVHASPMYSLLSRANSTVQLAFTFDPAGL